MGKRVFLLVIDGFGVGECPDSYKFNDEGSNTFLNMNKIRPLNIPNLEKLGLKSIDGLNLGKFNTIGSYGKMQEKSVGKDTTTGHFEMMKIITEVPSPTFPKGFPDEVINDLEKVWGTKILGNCVASGTEIIERLGDEHLKTGYPIVYTSADSVLQIATHTDIYSLDELYDLCSKAREIMKGEFAVGRVIARPFMTNNCGEFERMSTMRKDFSLSPKKPNTMSLLTDNGFDSIAVGKISDIFNHESITGDYPSHTNKEAIETTLNLLDKDFNGLCFVNLVDTDMLYGHRNDVEGYAKAIEEIDGVIPKIINGLKSDDILIITGDHGNDPTTVSTDHSREYTPCLIYSKSLEKSVNLGILDGFDSIGKFIENLFDISNEKSVIFEKLYGEK